jgi:hypothetical protein
VAYEFGQHFVPLMRGKGGNLQPYTPAIYAAQTHPLMAKAYEMMLHSMEDAGISLACHLNDQSVPGIYGCWGARVYQDDPISMAAAPKYATLAAWATASDLRRTGSSASKPARSSVSQQHQPGRRQ